MANLCPMHYSVGIELTRIIPFEEEVARVELDPEYRKQFADQHRRACMYKAHSFLDGMGTYTPSESWETLARLDENITTLPENGSIVGHVLGLLIKQRHVGETRRRVQLAHQHFGLRRREHPLIRTWSIDPCCIEVSSQPLNHWRDLHAFFKLADTYLDESGLKRHSDVIAGTGGHVNLGLTPEEIFHTQQLLLNHPWVMMAFADPRDDQHPLENRSNMDERQNVPGMNLTPPLYRRFSARCSHDYVEDWISLKNRHPIAYRDDPCRAEFRFFDIAQTWGMQEEHVAFAQAFAHYASMHPVRSLKRLMSQEAVVGLTLEECLQGFQRTVHMLGLPWSRYRWYAENNLRLRFEFGTDNFRTDPGPCGTLWPAAVAALRQHLMDKSN